MPITREWAFHTHAQLFSCHVHRRHVHLCCLKFAVSVVLFLNGKMSEKMRHALNQSGSPHFLVGAVKITRSVSQDRQSIHWP